MRRRAVTVSVLAITLLAGGGMGLRYWVDSPGSASPASILPAVPVVAGSVTSHAVPIYLRGVGTVIAYNTVVVRSQIQGQITQIAFTEGQAVRVGDLLAQIDPRPYQAQLDQTIATRDRDQAQLTNAQANLDRYSQLLRTAKTTRSSSTKALWVWWTIRSCRRPAPSA
jgi:multidrug efflux system membrane fusion protein